MKFRLVACEIFARELANALANSPHRVSLRFLPFKLHEQGGAAMAKRLQEAIDEEADGFDAILLGYCLCNNGIIGLQAREIPLVAFRSNDCIACLLGSKERFDAEHAQTPGTYWLSSGWLEQAGTDASAQLCAMPENPPPDHPKWLELIGKYGEDNARFLWEEERKALSHYERIAYIDTGLGPQTEFEQVARQRAQQLKLRFEKVTGSREWIDALLSGKWDERRFIVVKPGEGIAPRYDGSIACPEILK